MQAAQAARITPAGAGKTLTREAGCDKIKDHPRRCGENHIPHRGVYSLSGSPPQVRGKQTRAERGRSEKRITPAGAGKTFRSTAHKSRNPDHPRRCGENCARKSTASAGPGSPPQVRGKQNRAERGRSEKRITPAGAGKTGGGGKRAKGSQDHPRRCGENTKKIL